LPKGLTLGVQCSKTPTSKRGDFSRANFSGATFHNTKFNKTILTGANFDGATFVNCNLNRVNLAGASFHVKEITETVVYGIAGWDLKTSDDMKQSKLVIERTYELYSDLIQQGKVPMMVDDIELAQFVYYLSNHKKMRDALNILNDRGVLLLGRFTDGGLERLYSTREWFQHNGYMAMIFDFARPDNLSLIETVVTMAGLSKFFVADLSGSSVPAELHSIFSQIKKPVLAFGNPYVLLTCPRKIGPCGKLEDGRREGGSYEKEEVYAGADHRQASGG
jgi:Pentapeptide repeats (9 copies)